jgi:hypothetical protein
LNVDFDRRARHEEQVVTILIRCMYVQR